MLAVPFRRLYSSTLLLSLLLFLFFLVFLSYSSFKTVIATYKSSSSILLLHGLLRGTTTVFKDWANRSFICCLFYILRTLIKIRLKKPSVLFALVHMLLIKYICIPSRGMCNCDAKVFNGIYIVEDPLSVRSLNFIGSSASYLHNTLLNGLKSYTQFSCATS